MVILQYNWMFILYYVSSQFWYIYKPGSYSSLLDGLSIHPQSSLLLKVSFSSYVSLSFPSEELNILYGQKFLLYKIIHAFLESLISWSGPAKRVWKRSSQKKWRGRYTHFSQLLLFLLTPLLLCWSWCLN